MPVRNIAVPDPNSPQELLIEFAASYNAYKYISENSRTLQGIYQPFEDDFRRESALDESLGIDFMRGWLFLLHRIDYFNGGSDWKDTDNAWLDRLWRELVYSIGIKSKGKVPVKE
jgi:hypothetical protein